MVVSVFLLAGRPIDPKLWSTPNYLNTYWIDEHCFLDFIYLDNHGTQKMKHTDFGDPFDLTFYTTKSFTFWISETLHNY